ncbi:nose resistant to fluoxetine protein 6-like isoform X2 [Prorops nasuta]|uniref:nose resistant to fluoxetine protein 6-like isoform X2 n=1 Tax=Prorops nasuta TaxID=863751 RepID=UPI0034CDBE6E
MCKRFHRLNIFLVLSCWSFGSVLANDRSNILRLGKPGRKSSIALEFTSTTTTQKNQADEIHFSNNNPELDWKEQLKAIDPEIIATDQSDIDFAIEKLNSTANSIQWLSDLYDPLKWARVPGTKLNQTCSQDMEFYLSSLKQGKLWAAKMSDASGRYSSQFYFGNGFWLGSSSLCKELRSRSINENLSVDERPPYPVGFHVARIYIDLPKELELTRTRQVFLGLCLPASCDEASLASLLRASADRVERQGNSTYGSGGPSVHIVAVKPVPSSDYCAWTDSKFYVLAAITAVIVLLMICATAYDYKDLSKPPLDVDSESPSNNNERIQDNGMELMEKEKENARKKMALTDSNSKTDKQGKKGLWLRCLMAFSPVVNGSKIINTEPAARDSLTCLHGLRVFSLGWVVLVHTYLQVFSIAENKTLRTVTERNFMFQTISNATFSVDTFFFISGLLVTILFYRSLGGINGNDNKEGSGFLKSSFKKFIIMILYRFIRLTPAYLFVLGMNEIGIKQAQARTVFSPAIIDHFTCEKFWWRNALYINSLYPRTEMCMLWSWYMANDTQFYVLGILLLLLSVRYLKFVVITVLMIIVSSWFTTFSIAYSNDYIARIQEPFALFDELYDKPWLRAGPYFVGTITGYFLFRTKCKLRLPMIAQSVGWLLSAGAMTSLVYGLYPSNLTVTVSSVYASLGHTAWAIAIAFIVIQCCTGSARLIDSLLSLKLVYPLSRLTYCAYLVHPVIMMITSTQMDGPLHLHNGMVLIVYFGNLVASYLLSFCISIGLEAPVVNLLKIAFTTNKRTR